jgi:hypothetical protein
MRDFDCDFRTYLHHVYEHCVVSFGYDGRLVIGMLHMYGGLLFGIVARYTYRPGRILRFQALTAVLLRIRDSWDMTLCRRASGS